jgi:hypothetical protein
MYVDEGIVGESAFYFKYAKTHWSKEQELSLKNPFQLSCMNNKRIEIKAVRTVKL